MADVNWRYIFHVAAWNSIVGFSIIEGAWETVVTFENLK